MTQGARVTVAGAGALGLSIAVALADAGRQVTVCDPSPGGGAASAVAAGMLAPVFETVLDGDGPGDLGLLLAARDLWPGLAQRVGLAIDRSGALAIGSEAWLARIGEAMVALGARGMEIGRSTLPALAPGVAPAFERGLLTREDWRLEPHAALVALRTAAQAAGVEFKAVAATGRGAADWLVLATGAARDLAPELGLLTPIKGHILRAVVPQTGAVSVRGEGVYAAPVPGGLAIGATMEHGVADLLVDPGKAAGLRIAGAALFPALSDAPFEAFVGVRAATPDGLPLVGASAEPRVLLAAGARRNGWLLAPLVARIIAAQITGADVGPYAASFDPGRFAEPTAS